MGREMRKPGGSAASFAQLDRKPAMEKFARDKLSELGPDDHSKHQSSSRDLVRRPTPRRCSARAAAFGSKVIILDEPTAALKESRKVLELILDVRARGIPIILISHNMPHVFEVAQRPSSVRCRSKGLHDVEAFMTGAKEPPSEAVVSFSGLVAVVVAFALVGQARSQLGRGAGSIPCMH